MRDHVLYFSGQNCATFEMTSVRELIEESELVEHYLVTEFE